MDLGPADVVDETVDAAVPLARGPDETLGLPGARQVDRHVQVAAALGTPTRGHDRRPLGLELAGDLGADAARRAGHDADLARESQVHGWLG